MTDRNQNQNQHELGFARPFNLEAVEANARNLAEPALIVGWRSSVAEPTSQAGKGWTGLSRATVDDEQAAFGDTHEVTGTEDFALQPATVKGNNSLTFRYPARAVFTVNLRKLLKVADVTVPKGYRLIIPVEFKPVPGLTGDAMVLQFSKKRLEKIEKKGGSTQSSAK